MRERNGASHDVFLPFCLLEGRGRKPVYQTLSKRGVCLEGEGGPDPSVADLVIDFRGAPWFLQPSLRGGTACLACPRAGSLFLPSFGLREF